MPTTEINIEDFGDGMNLIELMEKAALIPSRAEGRRNIQQGGVSVNDVKITDIAHIVSKSDFGDNKLIIQKGKKTFHQIKLI